MKLIGIDPRLNTWIIEGHEGARENAVVECSCGQKATLKWNGEKMECINPRWRFTEKGWTCGKRRHVQLTTHQPTVEACC